jgi:uncharacterized protein
MNLGAAALERYIDLVRALARGGHAGDERGAEGTADTYGEDANVFVRGHIEGWLEVACSRCLGTARVPVDERLAITYLPKAQLPGEADVHEEDERGARDDEPGEEELGAELADEDVDLYGYEGEEVDLAPMIREQLVLAVPFAPLCIEECKGLCPQCGADQNREACRCEPLVDPRLAALKKLKI